jgi:hypothetical protein
MTTKVVIHISGGCVSRIQTNEPDYLDVVIIDWDDAEQNSDIFAENQKLQAEADRDAPHDI